MQVSQLEVQIAHIYSSDSSRVKGYNFDSFAYDEDAHIFSNKNKLIYMHTPMLGSKF